jgi:hypothetical protein
MIKSFEPASQSEPRRAGHVQWPAALGAGLIAGAILLFAPRGTPWSSVTFFTPIIMGRSLPAGETMPLILVWLIHLGISILYGGIISGFVSHLTRARAVWLGGIIGLALYFVNLLAVSLFWKELRGNEISVVFTHIVFGLIAAGAYRGLLQRKAIAVAPGP